MNALNVVAERIGELNHEINKLESRLERPHMFTENELKEIRRKIESLSSLAQVNKDVYEAIKMLSRGYH